MTAINIPSGNDRNAAKFDPGQSASRPTWCPLESSDFPLADDHSAIRPANALVNEAALRLHIIHGGNVRQAVLHCLLVFTILGPKQLTVINEEFSVHSY
jgi:hypothetical protein